MGGRESIPAKKITKGIRRRGTQKKTSFSEEREEERKGEKTVVQFIQTGRKNNPTSSALTLTRRGPGAFRYDVCDVRFVKKH